MSGTDAAGGFSYQHAQAIQAALELASNDELDRIRVEAENDVIDLEVWNKSGQLVSALQYKRRSDDYTWGQQELIDELTDWSALGATHTAAGYRFVTDGRLGPTGRDVRDALEEAADGDLAKLRELMKKAKSKVDLDVVRRAEIVVDKASYSSLIGRAQATAKSLIPNVTGPAEAAERSRWVVLELLSMVTGRSGEPEAARRFIARDEVLELLATPQDRIPTTRWTTDFKSTFIATVLSASLERQVDLETVLDSPGFGDADQTPMEERLLEDWLGIRHVCVLGGGSGTGKSTALMRMQRRRAEAGHVVLVADAEDYSPGRLAALVAAALNRHGDIGAHPAIGNAALKDPEVSLAIDGVSEIPQQLLDELRIELRAVASAEVRCRLVVTGRDTTAVGSTLPRGTPTVALKMSPLDHSWRRTFAAKVFGATSDEVEAIVAAAERALGDAARNPMLILLGMRAILLGDDASGPAKIFQTVVRSISSENGYSNGSLYEVALGIAYSHLLADGKRYTDSFGWTELLNKVVSQLLSRGQQLTADDLREYGFETGLVRITQLDSVRPLHDSFADYLSAVAIAVSVADLPDRLANNDRLRVRFLAELAGVDDELATKAASDLPLTSVSISQYDRRKPHPADQVSAKRYLDQLLPQSRQRPLVAYWLDSAGRCLVTVNGKFDGSWDEDVPEDIASAGWSFPLVDHEGPLQVATRIWRREVQDVLSVPKAAPSPAPSTRDESVRVLATYSDQLQATTSALVAALGISSESGNRLTELTQLRIQFLMSDSQTLDQERDRPVRFRYVPDLPAGEQVLLSGDWTGDIWTGWGRVDSFLSPPAHASARSLSEAINEAVGRRWL
ncbi:hypothetical protein [Mycolicibacterium sp. YH-1]|uniref:hypothetical protein n=1 Tax=Mycolicibacterium sp. YH-1 TaxID=2908837 RepID=UPI001F4BF861|nr:hypothetical protein [Mycolicibacterium sp. YH-1]UNB50923.1 hypothetical protein L0M16_23670 [Mycolicibacterium sp. YH-1]